MQHWALLLVVASGMTHAVWNLFAKRSKNRTVFLWTIHTVAFVALLPVAIHELWSVELSSRTISLLLLSLVFQFGYILLLPLAYQYGDMSQVYPAMRGTGALLVPVLGVLLLGESLTVWGWLGLLCIVVGLFAIGWLPAFGKKMASASDGKLGGGADRVRSGANEQAASLEAGTSPAAKLARFSGLGMLCAFGVGLCITGYTLTDKTLLGAWPPLLLLEVSNMAYVIGLLPAVIRSRNVRSEWTANKGLIALGALMAPGSYLLFLFAMQLAPVSHLAPVREIGTVFGTLLAIWVLKEKQGVQRVALAGLIFTGILIVGGLGS